jgi:hypothetical protein
VSSDSWPDEPDEPSNEPEEFDPMADIGPAVPEVDIPDTTKPSTEVPDDLARTFWKLVAVFNLALFALALGPMLVFFRGELVNGAAVFVLGAGCFVYGYARYRRYVDSRDGEQTADDQRGVDPDE